MLVILEAKKIRNIIHPYLLKDQKCLFVCKEGTGGELLIMRLEAYLKKYTDFKKQKRNTEL